VLQENAVVLSSASDTSLQCARGLRTQSARQELPAVPQLSSTTAAMGISFSASPNSQQVSALSVIDAHGSFDTSRKADVGDLEAIAILPLDLSVCCPLPAPCSLLVHLSGLNP
jgi:hypothetical protein